MSALKDEAKTQYWADKGFYHGLSAGIEDGIVKPRSLVRREDTMYTVFVTRPEYDSLVRTYPKFMQCGLWQLFDRQWTMEGVRVRGSRYRIKALCELLGRA